MFPQKINKKYKKKDFNRQEISNIRNHEMKSNIKKLKHWCLPKMLLIAKIRTNNCIFHSEKKNFYLHSQFM